MRKVILCVLLAALVASLPVALLCSCGGCSSKSMNAPAEVRGTAVGNAAGQNMTAMQKEPGVADRILASEGSVTEGSAVHTDYEDMKTEYVPTDYANPRTGYTPVSYTDPKAGYVPVNYANPNPNIVYIPVTCADSRVVYIPVSYSDSKMAYVPVNPAYTEMECAPVEQAPVRAVQSKPAPKKPVVERVSAPEPVEQAPVRAVQSKPAPKKPVVERVSAPEPVEQAPVRAVQSKPVPKKTIVKKTAAPAQVEKASSAPSKVEKASSKVAKSAVVAKAAKKKSGTSIITEGISPWAWQRFHSDKSGIDDKSSSYGLGAKLAYTYLFGSGFYMGAEAAYQTYFMDGSKNFHDIMFLADAGYNFNLTEKLGLYAGLGGGVAIECYDGETSPVAIAKADLGLSGSIAEHWGLGGGCDFLMGFSKADDANQLNFQIIPSITASYKF